MAEVTIRSLVIAGWTGRDEAALKKHIRELEELGVKPPKTTPIFYRVSANLLTTATEIQVSGPDLKNVHLSVSPFELSKVGQLDQR